MGGCIKNSMLHHIKNWVKKKRSWEVVESGVYHYDEVVKQSTFISVKIYEERKMRNTLTGEVKEDREVVDCISLSCRWAVGGMVRWNGEFVYAVDNLRIFGDVARGYRR